MGGWIGYTYTPIANTSIRNPPPRLPPNTHNTPPHPQVRFRSQQEALSRSYANDNIKPSRYARNLRLHVLKVNNRIESMGLSMIDSVGIRVDRWEPAQNSQHFVQKPPPTSSPPKLFI